MATGRDELIQQNIQRAGSPTLSSLISSVGSKTMGDSGPKKNSEAIRYGTLQGSIKFGHLHLDNESRKQSAVTSGVFLQAFDSRHYMSMDNDGVRKGWTLNRCPGTYQIKCATDIKGSMEGGEQFGFVVFCENGDIVLRAPNGRIKMSALDIDIRAEGPNNTRGTVNIDSNQSVNVKTGTFDVNASTGVRVFTPKSMNLIANTSAHIVSNFVNGLSCASNYLNKPNKAYPVSSAEYQGKQLYNPIGTIF